MDAAYSSLAILQDGFTQADGVDPEHFGGRKKMLNNVSMVFTPGLSVHFVHWNDPKTQRGQYCDTDGNDCIKSVVNYVNKSRSFAPTVSGSVMIVPDVGVPMIRDKGVRHKVPVDTLKLRRIWEGAVAPAESSNFAPCALCNCAAVHICCFLCNHSWHTRCADQIQLMAARASPRRVQIKMRVTWPRVLFESPSLCQPCATLVDLESAS